jgi:Acyl-CoA reductase (LuxC)
MHLVERPVRSIVRAVAAAAARWADADFPPRVRVLGAICARTGYSEPVAEYALDRLFGSLSVAAIEAAIVAELGSLAVLDDFVARPDGVRARALPAGRACVISSRTTIGVALTPAVFALCAKCDVVVKDREDALIAAFFRTLAEEDAAFAEAAIARSWDSQRDSADLGSNATIVAFGDDQTLAAIRRTLPIRTRMIAFGSKASCGYVGRDALGDVAAARRVAEGAARDFLLYDTQGCLSLHVLFVERGAAVSVAEFNDLLGGAIDSARVEFPLGRRDPGDAVRVAAARDRAVFRAAAGSGAVRATPAAEYVTVLNPPLDEPPSFLPRVLGVHAVDGPERAAGYLARHRIPIEAIAVAGVRGDLRRMAAGIGAARIAAFGELQHPPVSGYHGGRPRIAEFVRWLTDET